MVLGLRIYLGVYLVSVLLSVVLGPRRGHSLFVSTLGGLVLGPLNLLLIFLLAPPGSGGKGKPGRSPQ